MSGKRQIVDTLDAQEGSGGVGQNTKKKTGSGTFFNARGCCMELLETNRIAKEQDPWPFLQAVDRVR